MSDEPLAFSPEQFSGRTRIFPLPNLVMFPHVMQALHIFEPRYRALFEEALEGDRLVSLAVLAPGWEQQYEGRPPLRPTACLCRIATHQVTKQGTYNVLLLGVRRLRLGNEMPAVRPFRVFEAEIVLLASFGATRIGSGLRAAAFKKRPLFHLLRNSCRSFSRTLNDFSTIRRSHCSSTADWCTPSSRPFTLLSTETAGSDDY